MASNKKGLTKKQKAQVQKIIQRNQETKMILHSYDTTVQDTGRTPVTTNLNDCAQGDDQNHRTGNQILCTGMYGQFVITYADTTNLVRLVIYMPHDTDDEFTTLTPISFYDMDKHTVLYDKTFAVGSGGPMFKKITIKRKFNKGRRRGILGKFSTTAAGSMEKGLIKLYAVSDSTAVSDPALQGYVRVYFKDG